QAWLIRSDDQFERWRSSMKTEARAGAVLLAGILAGSAYGMTLTLPQQSQQDNSGQKQDPQNQDKKKKNSQGGNSKDAPANQGGTQTGATPPANNPPPAGNPSGGDKPTPLFGGTIGLKSSRQSTD